MKYSEFVDTLSSKVEKIEGYDKMELLHGAMGLSTESNEVLDQMKKVIFYGTELDIINIKEELGDIMFYFQMIMNRLDLNLDDIIETNKAKLIARYGDKFSKEKAVNRDLEKERKILEG